MGDVIDREAFFENRKLSNLQLGLQQQAMEIMNVALLGGPCMIGEEPVYLIPEELLNAPSELNPQDSA